MPGVYTEFMVSLGKKLQEDRKIANSTVAQYLQTLTKLNGSKLFKNLNWTRDVEAVQSIIDTYSPSTQNNQYMVLTSALSTVSNKAAYKKAYSHWREKMLSTRSRDEEADHKMTTKQKENWASWDDVLKAKEKLKENVASLSSTKRITPSQWDKLQQYLVVSLYTTIAPRRNQDYLDMFVIKKWTNDEPKDKNYFDVASDRFIFNKYKTATKYGEQIVEVPNHDEAPLGEVLKLYLKYHPLSKSKTPYKLLVKADGTPLTTVNAITRILNKAFEKRIGSSMLRHLYLSSKYGDTIKEMEKDAVVMSHSTGLQRNYVKYDDDTSDAESE